MLRAWSCLPSAPWLRQGLENEATPLKSLMRTQEGLTAAAAAHTALTLCPAGPSLAEVRGYHAALVQPAALPWVAPRLLAAPLDFTG